MNLPRLQDIDVKGKRVLLRLDLDVSLQDQVVQEDYRLKASIPTVKYLLDHECGRIIILGHRGRPHSAEASRGKPDKSLSLEPVAKHLEKLLTDYLGKERMKTLDMFVMENLRFDAREEASDESLARELAKEGDVYINDAFGVCHREEASIVVLPKLLPHAAGLRLQEEVENLEKVLQPPKKPVVVVVIVGGGKMDKVLLIDKLFKHANTVLVGGVLPKKIKTYCRDDGKECIVAAHLTPSGEDITPDSARNFAEVIKGAGTIVWNGPMGDIDSGFWDGTEIVADAMSDSRGFKVVGGGDTIRALQTLGLLEKMDYVSTGGGAMLEFLAYGDLPGLAALRDI